MAPNTDRWVVTITESLLHQQCFTVFTQHCTQDQSQQTQARQALSTREVTKGRQKKQRAQVPEKSQQCRKYLLQYSMVYSLPKDLRFTHGGAKLVSCPRCHLASVRPCFQHGHIKIIQKLITKVDIKILLEQHWNAYVEKWKALQGIHILHKATKSHSKRL